MGEFIDMKNISTLIPDIKQEMLPDDEEEKKYAHIRYKERYYKAEIMKVCIDDFAMDNKVVELQPEAYQLFAFYLFDETEIRMSRKEIQNQKLICGIKDQCAFCVCKCQLKCSCLFSPEGQLVYILFASD